MISLLANEHIIRTAACQAWHCYNALIGMYMNHTHLVTSLAIRIAFHCVQDIRQKSIDMMVYVHSSVTLLDGSRCEGHHNCNQYRAGISQSSC